MSNLTRTQKQYIVLYTGYVIALLIAFRNVFIGNYANAFLSLFGLKSRWFVYDPTNILPPIPGDPNSPGVPSYPVPPWTDVPIITPNYWKVFGYSLFRTIIIALAALVVWLILFWIIKRYEYKSKKQTTIVYKIYTNTIRDWVKNITDKIKNYMFEILKLILNKINAITMFLLVFLISGWGVLIISGLIQSMWDLFIYSPGVWTLLHIKAILFGFFEFLSSFTVINLLVVAVIIYLIVSFIYAYIEQSNKDKKLEEKLKEMPHGVDVVGPSGVGKTMLLQAIGSASQRVTKSSIMSWLEDNESAYGRIVDFNLVRKFYADNKSKLRNTIDCEDLNVKFINQFKIDNVQLDRFMGQTPKLHEKLKWHFIGLWLTDKRRLVVSTIPMIINDKTLSEEVRDNIWDLLTRRHEDVFSLRFNFNSIKKTINNLMGKVDEFGNLQISAEETGLARLKFKEANFSIEPCMTLVLPELDKDLHNSDRNKIIKDGTDKFLAVLRHFTSFDERSFSHIIFDAQQPDGVANVVRGRFDYILFINSSKKKRSLFFVPYIMYLTSRINMWTKIRKLSTEYSPYKKSFFRIFIAWRLERLTRWLDYFNSFGHHKISATSMETNGENKMTLEVNFATSYYQYKSTQFQDIYQKAKREKATFRYENLEPWSGNRFTTDDAIGLNSKFVDSVFGIAREKDEEEDEENSAEDFDSEIAKLKTKAKAKVKKNK